MLPATLYSPSTERLFGILLVLAFGVQYALEARLGGLNVFLLYGVGPFLEAMENLDGVCSTHIQDAIPCLLVLFAQFIGTRSHFANQFSVWRSLAKLQPV